MRKLKLRLHDTIYRLRFYSNSSSHILSLSNSDNNEASLQKNGGDKSYRVIVVLFCRYFVNVRACGRVLVSDKLIQRIMLIMMSVMSL